MQDKINQFINVLIAEHWDEILTDASFHFTHEEMSDWLWTYEQSFNDLFDPDLIETEVRHSGQIPMTQDNYEKAYEQITLEAIDLAVKELERRLSDIRQTLTELFNKHTNTQIDATY